MVLQSWREQVAADQEHAVQLLRAYGLLPENTTNEIVTGASWVDVMDELDWEPGEVLVVGSSPVGAAGQGLPGLPGHQDRAATHRCR